MNSYSYNRVYINMLDVYNYIAVTDKGVEAFKESLVALAPFDTDVMNALYNKDYHAVHRIIKYQIDNE